MRQEHKDEICTGLEGLNPLADGLANVASISDTVLPSIMRGNLVRERYEVRNLNNELVIYT